MAEKRIAGSLWTDATSTGDLHLKDGHSSIKIQKEDISALRAALDIYDERIFTGASGRKFKSNKESGIVYDRPVAYPDGRIYGTGIVMIHIRRRKTDEKSAYTKEVAPGWIVDFDKDDKPIEIEVLDSSAFPKEILALLPPEFLEVE